MPITLSSTQILALAPDASSAKSGKGLAVAKSWVTLGQKDQIVWGECQGSGKDPYRTQVDLNGPAFRCSCPSRKFPCKHALGLLLLLSAQPDLAKANEPPAWVSDWLATREKTAQRREQAAQPSDDPEAQKKRAAAQAKTAAAREAKVTAGMQELGRWLRDQMRQGLAALPSNSPGVFNTVAARMVDAQAQPVARILRAMGGIPATGDGWQSRMLEQFSRLHLLVEGFQHIDTLSPAEQADLRAAIGFNQNQDEVLEGPAQADRWIVLGQQLYDEDPLRVQRSWLWGERSQQPALVLNFAAGNQPLDKSLVPGTVLDGELAFFPGATPLRALRKQGNINAEPLSSLPQMSIHAAIARYAQAFAKSPWIDRFPLLIGPITLTKQADAWFVRDAEGATLPIHHAFDRAWELLARSGGRPITLVAEWDGVALSPLSAWIDEFVALNSSDPLEQYLPFTVNPSSAWTDILTAALLGTDRRSFPLPALSGAVGSAVGQLNIPDDQPGQMLSAAAVLSAHNRAGWQPMPQGEQTQFPLAPAETLPVCSPLAAQHLTQLMNTNGYRAILPEWLAAAAARQVRIPEYLLPELLSMGQREKALQSAILPVIGQRGHWLAQQNKAWSYAAPALSSEEAAEASIEQLTELWETSPRAARVTLLEGLRQSNPTQALALINLTWRSEKADDRLAFIETLNTGLSMADEPFLEAALDDRGERVRTQAAEFLGNLPESRLVQRITAHALPLLEWVPAEPSRLLGLKPGEPAKIKVNLPESLDPALSRDGIALKVPSHVKIGEKAWWMKQLIAAVPPTVWSEAWGVSPQQIVQAKLPKDWMKQVRDSWIQSTLRTNDPEWTNALADLEDVRDNYATISQFLNQLPTARSEAILIDALKGKELSSNHPMFNFVRRNSDLWSRELTLVIFDGMNRYLAKKDEQKRANEWSLRYAVAQFVFNIPPSMFDEMHLLWPNKLDESWQETYDSFIDVIQFRKALLQELAQNPR